jgi:hypothetical protein
MGPYRDVIGMSLYGPIDVLINPIAKVHWTCLEQTRITYERRWYYESQRSHEKKQRDNGNRIC